jgi:hypothetical protein
MDMASKVGLMERIMKDIGYIIKLMVKVYFGTQKEICIEGNLKMIWPTATGNTHILTAQNTRVSL